MNLDIVVLNLLNPAVLFFLLGLLAVGIRSDLNIPQPVSKFLSLYLLFCIGLKGGEELGHHPPGGLAWLTLGLAVLMSFAVPFYTFFWLKKRFKVADAGAIAATYGSVSAVTFVSATAFLQDLGEAFGGHMIAALALMESPAIIAGVWLVSRYSAGEDKPKPATILHEALANGSVVLIMGSLLIGAVAPSAALEPIHPFTNGLFKGMLCLFLLDMGLLAGKRIRLLLRHGKRALAFSIVVPLINAAAAIGLSVLLQLSHGDALLLTVLCASASYIAVPAAMRIAVPEANPGLFVPMSLAITFPFNIIVGIPIYYRIIQHLL